MGIGTLRGNLWGQVFSRPLLYDLFHSTGSGTEPLPIGRQSHCPRSVTVILIRPGSILGQTAELLKW